MIQLPIVIEQTTRWYWFAIPLFGPLTVLFLYMMVMSAFRRKAKPFFAALPFALVGLWFILQPLHWQARIDDEGMTIKAPLNPFTGTPGHIAWKNLEKVWVLSVSHRGGRSYYIEFTGPYEKFETVKLELQNLHSYPASLWPTLIATIESKAPQAKFMPSKEEWLDRLKVATAPETVPFTTLRGYSVRDGNGQIVQ